MKGSAFLPTCAREPVFPCRPTFMNRRRPRLPLERSTCCRFPRSCRGRPIRSSLRRAAARPARAAHHEAETDRHRRARDGFRVGSTRVYPERGRGVKTIDIDIALARKVLKTEADAITALIERLDERFENAVRILLDCRGRVIVTGMGKSGIIARKIAATLSSTGTPSFF